MIKNNRHIEIVRSRVRGLSSMSKESCDAIFAVLVKHFSDVGVTIVNNLSDLENLIDCRPDLVFLGMEFIPVNPALGLADPNKIWLSDYLDSHNIAYTGSSRTAHEIQRDKPLAKQCILDAGLSTSPFCVIKQNQLLDSSDISLTYPMFVKPTNRGGGLGIDSNSVVHDFEQLSSKVQSITTDFNADSLVETYLSGREFSVAILEKEHSSGLLVMPIELVAPYDENGVRLLSGQIKTSNTEQALEITDEVLKSNVADLATDIFYALGARDYGRIDIRSDATGTLHFLEANLIPSLISGYGSFPKACLLNIGMEYEPMIISLVELGLERSENDIEIATELGATLDPVFPFNTVALDQI